MKQKGSRLVKSFLQARVRACLTKTPSGQADLGYFASLHSPVQVWSPWQWWGCSFWTYQASRHSLFSLRAQLPTDTHLTHAAGTGPCVTAEFNRETPAVNALQSIKMYTHWKKLELKSIREISSLCLVYWFKVIILNSCGYPQFSHSLCGSESTKHRRDAGSVTWRTLFLLCPQKWCPKVFLEASKYCAVTSGKLTACPN